MQQQLRLVRLANVHSALRSLICLLLGLTATLALAEEGASRWDRDDYANTPYPIWSPLSYFESATLADRHLAVKGDPDALLALYVVASGTRESTDYEGIRRRIDAFVSRQKDSLTSQRDPWRKGQLLNRAMHEEFFLPPGDHRAPDGYQTDQSRLVGIFETSEFNCISASLLFTVLAQHFDLRASGVLLPSHAFIQLDLPDGRTVEVETTSADGYDQLHDEKFYQRVAESWFSDRGLSASTYDDYRKREIVNPVKLGALNMLNQHTAPGRMAAEDRARLAEISAFLEPNNEAAQQNRLHFLAQEAALLSDAGQWQDIIRLYQKTFPAVRADAKRFPQNDNIQNGVQWLRIAALTAFAQTGDVQQVIALITDLDRDAIGNPKQQQQILAAINHAVSVTLNRVADQNHFEDGLLLISLAESQLSHFPAWPETINWFYNRWAQSRWQQEDWPGVIDVLEDYFAQPHQIPGDQKQLKNLGAAYQNWGLSYIRLGELDAAQTVVDECTSRFEEKGVCHAVQESVDTARHQKRKHKR